MLAFIYLTYHKLSYFESEKMYQFLLLFGICITGINCGYYFVTAPNIIRFDNDETVVVSVFGLTHATVKVWLQHGNNRISEKNVVVEDEKTPQNTTVRVTENDLFNTVVEVDKPRTIRIFSEWKGNTTWREIILSYKTGYFFVQTDKPIYTPLQKVKIRTLALDESLRKVNGWQVVIDIVDPSNRTLGRKKMENSTSGFFDHQVRLPPYPEFGVWTVRAFYKGQLETEARSLFEVQEYVLPTFGVEIDVDVPYILNDTLNDTASIQVTVRAKYVYGKPVDGNARLTLKLKDKTELSEYILDVNKRTLEKKNNKEGSVTEFSIKVSDILNSPLLKNNTFPDGKRLEVDATVYESVTGKEEATSHDGTVFANKPYIFKFTKSKLNFRPGMEYFLKVDLLKANGELAARETIKAKMYKNGVLYQSITSTTDENGLAVFLFQTSDNADVIKFTAETTNKRQESERFQVEAYGGTNQIQVEHIIKENKMIMRAFTNIKPGGYTGMLFMVVTRGKIVYTSFKEAANQASEHIMEELQEIVSPEARLLVFYVDKGTSELVADSTKFDVGKKCRDKGLNLTTDKTEVNPGSNADLTVTGSPYMAVGLNVMDKALLLLSNKNVLRKNKMFEALQSHDLGCGSGSGKNSADVFKKSGLTVLTNAVIDENDLVRNTAECGKKRRKRDSEDCYGANQMCCDQGYEFADELIYHHTDDIGSLDKYVNCYTKARDLARKYQLPMTCIMAFFRTCLKVVDDFISDNSRITSKSLSDQSSYEKDLAKFNEAGVQLKVRKQFQESWLFELIELDKKGQIIKSINFPDSITDWMIQAIGITPDKGMCIAEDIDVKAFREFFIQLDLPYKAVRLEHFDVKATIFNYGNSMDKDVLANIYLDGVADLCFNSIPGKQSPKVRINLPPNSAKTVSFPMIPLRKGQFSVKVTAIVTKDGLPKMDAIEKKLYVVNEGVEEKIAIHVCLDLLDQRDDCKNDDRVKIVANSDAIRYYNISLTLPNNSIPQSGSAAAYIQSNLMTDVIETIIEGVDSLFKLPSGCGEQTMVKLAPTVYAMTYLKQTKQTTMDIETKGNQWIRDGIVHEESQYQQSDGSYAIWKNSKPSTWLTAFVAKVFCQANKTIDDAIDENKIKDTIDWLIKRVKNDGSFVDDMPVRDRLMLGQTNERDPSLTAFVIITLQECEIRSNDLNDTIAKAKTFLEGLPDSVFKKSPYLLAISTYALALVDSPKKYRFKALLHQIQNKDENYLYWGNAGGSPASANSVETTAYALLAMLEFNDFKNSAFIVRWLTSQRDASGSFRSTQDTVVGLQALSKYSIATYSAEVDLKVTLIANNENWNAIEIPITKENAVLQKNVTKGKLPVEHKDNILTVIVSGTGSGIMTIDLRYNRPASENESCPFIISDVQVEHINNTEIDVNLAKERKCDVCGKCLLGPKEIDNYDLDKFDVPERGDLKQESHFGRRKRQVNKGTSAKHKTTCIRFSVSAKNNAVHGMSIVNFGLETGVNVVKSDLEQLMKENNTNIARYEMPSNGHGFVIFYLHKVTSQETKFIFRLKDEFDDDMTSRQPSSVKVYDYYNPEWHCTKLYGTGPNREQSVALTCDKSDKWRNQCQCLQSMCAKPVEEEIKRMVKENGKPALALFRYTCNPAKANYAVRVKIVSLDNNTETNQMIAGAKVLKSFNKGVEKLENGDEMTFFWDMNCEQPKPEIGAQYIIIGMDGNMGGDDKYRYPLMGTAVVLRDYQNRKENRLQFNVLKKYVRFIESKGCQS